MYPEPEPSQVMVMFFVHLWFSQISTMSHQAVYFMSNTTFWGIHFAHYFFVFVTLLISCLFRYTDFKRLPLVDMLPVCASQLVVTVATCLVHDVGSNGALYAQRLTDGVVTMIVYYIARFFIPANLSIQPQHKILLFVLGTVCSLGWYESIITFRLSYIYLLPLLDISTAVHLLITVKKYRKMDVPLNTFMLNVSGLTSLFLLPTALLFTTDSVTKEWYVIRSAWELSDVGLLGMSYVGYSMMIYSKYWLICKCTQETYLYLRHVKYHLANYGQLFTQNFNFTPVSIVARPIGTILVAIYFRRRYKLHSTEVKHYVVQNSV